MANISNIRLNETDYEIKDAFARNNISLLSEAINLINDGITSLNNDVGVLNNYVINENATYLTVGHTGCRFNTITEALNYAKEYCTDNTRVVILVFSGKYNEEIILNHNTGIDIIGVGNVTVYYNSTYPNSPLFMFGNGRVENITFVNTNADGNAYAFHYEAQNDMSIVDTECVINNCSFTSFGNASCGIGLGDGHTLKMFNCNLYNTNPNSPAIYLHNLPFATSKAGQFEAHNCLFNVTATQSILVDNARRIQGNAGVSQLYLTFDRCVTNTTAKKVVYRYSTTEFQNFFNDSGEIALTNNSVENNMPGITKGKNNLTFYGYIPTTYEGGSWGRFFIPIPDANLYEWTISQSLNDLNNTDVSGSTSILNVTPFGINGQVTANVIGLNISVTGVPI